MARRRMFSAELTSSDRFLDMSTDTQCFYFHLSLHADDEGFVSSPKCLGLLCGGSEANLKEMEDAGFIIRFSTGVLVIVDWMLNNTIRKDRSMATIHRKEKGMVTLVHDRYVLRSDVANVPADLTTNLSTQNRIEENRIDNSILNNNKSEYIISEETGGDKGATWAAETSDEKRYPDIVTVLNYCRERNLNYVNVEEFYDYYQKQNWCDEDGKPIEDWKYLLCLRNASEFANRLAMGLEV